MLELTWNGTEPITLEDATQRSFLNDGDIIQMRGWAGNDDRYVTLGEVRNTVVPTTLT